MLIVVQTKLNEKLIFKNLMLAQHQNNRLIFFFTECNSNALHFHTISRALSFKFVLGIQPS